MPTSDLISLNQVKLRKLKHICKMMIWKKCVDKKKID